MPAAPARLADSNGASGVLPRRAQGGGLFLHSKKASAKEHTRGAQARYCGGFHPACAIGASANIAGLAGGAYGATSSFGH